METETTARVVPIRPTAELASYSTSALLQAVITLTHYVHDCTDTERADAYREQREVALAEVQRRTGER